MMHQVEQIMGTAISLDLADPLSPARLGELAAAAFAGLRAVDDRFSTYKDGSEVNRLQRGEITLAECSADLRHVLDECSRLWRTTDGYFDAYATGRLDPSGYVKGWSVQVASDALAAGGALNHCLNAGGDICVRGGPEPGAKWRVGIRHPWEPMKVAWVLEVTDVAVATSGTYERGLHVVDPFTGRGAGELVSVTVVGPDLALADAYATTATAMGRSGLAWLAALAGYESAAVTQDGEAFTSTGWPVAAQF